MAAPAHRSGSGADDVTPTTMFERRVIAPWGVAGGGDGAPFRGTLQRNGEAVDEALDGRGRVDDARVAVAGVGPRPLRVAFAEEALHGREPTVEPIAAAAAAVREHVRPESDAFVSAAYRRHCAGVLARRALARAVARAMEVRSPCA